MVAAVRVADLVTLFVFAIVLGNLLISSAWIWARATTSTPDVPRLPGVSNLAASDDRLWRGAAPSEAGYRALVRHGVTTVVDLRAEKHICVPHELLADLRLKHVAIPLRDGQAPSREQTDFFVRVVESNRGRVFVHCAAGVGRAGAMAAAYLVKSGKMSATAALRKNLAVGPPSLEQIAFVVRLGIDWIDRRNVVLTGLSRVLDAPRRILFRITRAYSN